jgi:hypothetical protein
MEGVATKRDESPRSDGTWPQSQHFCARTNEINKSSESGHYTAITIFATVATLAAVGSFEALEIKKMHRV